LQAVSNAIAVRVKAEEASKRASTRKVGASKRHEPLPCAHVNSILDLEKVCGIIILSAACRKFAAERDKGPVPDAKTAEVKVDGALDPLAIEVLADKEWAVKACVCRDAGSRARTKGIATQV